MKPVLVVIATYPTGRHPESCARSSWRVAAARGPDIDTVVGVYQGMVVAVIRGRSLVPSTPEVVGDDWDEACRGAITPWAARHLPIGICLVTDPLPTVAGTLVERTRDPLSLTLGVRQDPDGKCAAEVTRIGNSLALALTDSFKPSLFYPPY